jgi:hypothetical protein
MAVITPYLAGDNPRSQSGHAATRPTGARPSLVAEAMDRDAISDVAVPAGT